MSAAPRTVHRLSVVESSTGSRSLIEVVSVAPQSVSSVVDRIADRVAVDGRVRSAVDQIARRPPVVRHV